MKWGTKSKDLDAILATHSNSSYSIPEQILDSMLWHRRQLTVVISFTHYDQKSFFLRWLLMVDCRLSGFWLHYMGHKQVSFSFYFCLLPPSNLQLDMLWPLASVHWMGFWKCLSFSLSKCLSFSLSKCLSFFYSSFSNIISFFSSCIFS